MAPLHTLLLAAIFFVTSAISVVTGSTSLITVPAMFEFGVSGRTALATNMFALTFMSIGGALPFARQGLDRRRLPLLIVLTLAGSTLGALLLLSVPQAAIKGVVSFAMIGVAVFSLIYRRAGADEVRAAPGKRAELAGYLLTFLLGIYGGFFSGGYVTILTALFVALFRMTFLEAIAVTKVLNIFSSAVATGVFMWNGLVDYRLGLLLAVAMFIGALLGARYAMRIGNLWLRRIYLTAVWILGLKAILIDLMHLDGRRPVPTTPS